MKINHGRKSWGNNDLSTYVELKPNVSAASVNKILYDFIQNTNQNLLQDLFYGVRMTGICVDEFENGVQTGGGQNSVCTHVFYYCMDHFINCMHQLYESCHSTK